MALQKKYARKSMLFLTPQSRKVQSPASRLSLSAAEKTPDLLLGSLLNDPIKRALLMEVLSQNSPKKTPLKDHEACKKTQKFKLESPSALCRRRAIEQMRLNSDSSGSSVGSRQDQFTRKVPFEQILKGVVAYVEIISNNKDRSSGAKALMQAMGAQIKDVLNREVTHVVFKDGSFKTYQKAKLLKVHLVSVLWIEAVRKNMYRVPEQNYPALGNAVSNANASVICHAFQKEYADVIEEELNKSKNLNVPFQIDASEHDSDDMIDTSQNYDIQSIGSAKNNMESSNTTATPNSLYLESIPELTSDSEYEHLPRNRIQKKLSKNKRISKYGINSREDENPKTNYETHINNDASEKIQINCNNVSDDKTTGTETEQLSSLRISADAIKDADRSKTPLQKVPNYNNVTERKKQKPRGKRNSINVLNNFVLKSPLQQDNLDQDLHETENLSDILIKRINKSLETLHNENIEPNVEPANKTSRRLYNVNDPIVSIDQPNNLEDNSRNSVNNVQIANNIKGTMNIKPNSIKRNSNFLTQTDAKQNSLTTPRRKSTRLLQKENIESTSKRTKRNIDSDDSDLSSDKSVILKSPRIAPFNTMTEEKDQNKTNKSKKKNSLEQLKSASAISVLSNLAGGDFSDWDTSGSKTSSPRKRVEKIISKLNVNSGDEFLEKNIPRTPNTIRNSASNLEMSNDVRPPPTKNNRSVVQNDESEDEAEQNPEIISIKPLRRSRRLSTIISTENRNQTERRSTMDFVPKTPISQSKLNNATANFKIRAIQKSKSLKKTSIVCTRFHTSEVQVFQQIVKKLGVFFVEDEVTNKTTHLVAAESRRTVNLLRAVARGCWVLKSEWLYRSLEANCWLPEEEFELTGFSVAVQKARQERQAFGARFSMDIFENCGKIYISKATNPRCSDLQELVTLCKGSLTTTVRNSDIVVGEYIKDKSCVTVSWIMDSITFYKKKSLKNYMIQSPD